MSRTDALCLAAALGWDLAMAAGFVVVQLLVKRLAPDRGES